MTNKIAVEIALSFNKESRRLLEAVQENKGSGPDVAAALTVAYAFHSLAQVINDLDDKGIINDD